MPITPKTDLKLVVDDRDIHSIVYEQYGIAPLEGNNEIVFTVTDEFLERCKDESAVKAIVITDDELEAILLKVKAIKMGQLLGATQ